MLFNSLSYAIFLPIVFFLYWIFPSKYRWVLLLIASYWFYMGWNPQYVFLIFITTLVSYTSGIIIYRSNSKAIKKCTLVCSFMTCFGILFIFKYLNFFSHSVSVLLKAINLCITPITTNLLLPVGISFYTFQTVSYIIDIYKGEAEPEYHFGKYAVFVSFFPQLVAGPIERTNDLLPQIKNMPTFSYSQATYGIKLMTWGFFKKMVVADTISMYTLKVFESPRDYHGFALLLSSFLFSFQIYCDFSGYSDIAVGTAKLFGVNLTKNFKSPYFSQSITDFWRRWHISLSTWFRDYVYIPMGGNRKGIVRRHINIIVTFLLSGLWHGADWKFVLWGGAHGTCQILESIVQPYRSKKNTIFLRMVRISITFVICTVAWALFASKSLNDACFIVMNSLNGIANPYIYLINGFKELGIGKIPAFTICFSILLLVIFDCVSLKKDCISIVSDLPPIKRHVIYISLLLLIIFFKASTPAEFVYFQF